MTAPAPGKAIAGAAGPRDGLVLQGEEITVRFGGLVALSTVSVAVPAHSIVGLIGPNGAGKSTLLAALSGMRQPDGGKVVLNGTDVTKMPPNARAKLGLARTFQRPALFDSLTVRSHVMLADRARHAPRRFWRDMITFGGFRSVGEAESERVAGILSALRLEEIADREVAGLPLGTGRLIEVARALATEPSVILLDEPASGLDAEERQLLSEVLAMLVTRQRTSILLVEHDLEMVLRLSGQVYVLDFGSCIASGSPEQIRDNPAVQAAYMGDDIAIGGGQD